MISAVVHADVSGDVVYSRFYNTSLDLFRNNGTDLTEQAANVGAVGIDDGIFGMVGTVDGNVVLARKYNNGFDLISYDGSTLAEVGRMSSTTGMDDGLFGMVAAADGTVVIARTYDPAGPNAGAGLGFDLLRYDPTTHPVENLNRSAQNIAGVDDGLFGMVAATDGTVVVARLYDPAGPNAGAGLGFDLLRYDIDPDPNNPAANIVKINSSAQNIATVDDGLFGMVAAADGTVVVARTYDPAGPGAGAGLGFDLLRYDIDPDPNNPAANIVKINSSAQNIAGVDDGLLDMVATAGGDVVMIREYNGSWDLIGYDIDPDPNNPMANIVKQADNNGARGLDDGYLGAVALGNGDIVLARLSGTAIELFSYDGVTLAEKGNNTASNRGMDSGFLHMVGFPAQEIPEPASLLLLVSGLITVLSVSRARVRD